MPQGTRESLALELRVNTVRSAAPSTAVTAHSGWLKQLMLTVVRGPRSCQRCAFAILRNLAVGRPELQAEMLRQDVLYILVQCVKGPGAYSPREAGHPCSYVSSMWLVS